MSSLTNPPRCSDCIHWRRHAQERLPGAEWSHWGDCQSSQFDQKVQPDERAALNTHEDFGCVFFHPHPEQQYLFP